jgi:hypothetical protein
MPNRGELRLPVARAAQSSRAAEEMWAIVGICTIGFLMSIYLAVSSMGLDALPRLMSQFPGAM